VAAGAKPTRDNTSLTNPVTILSGEAAGAETVCGTTETACVVGTDVWVVASDVTVGRAVVGLTESAVTMGSDGCGRVSRGSVSGPVVGSGRANEFRFDLASSGRSDFGARSVSLELDLPTAVLAPPLAWTVPDGVDVGVEDVADLLSEAGVSVAVDVDAEVGVAVDAELADVDEDDDDEDDVDEADEEPSDSEDVLPLDGPAHAIAGVVAIAAPTPSATASAPTRPIYRAWQIAILLAPFWV